MNGTRSATWQPAVVETAAPDLQAHTHTHTRTQHAHTHTCPYSLSPAPSQWGVSTAPGAWRGSSTTLIQGFLNMFRRKLEGADLVMNQPVTRRFVDPMVSLRARMNGLGGSQL